MATRPGSRASGRGERFLISEIRRLAASQASLPGSTARRTTLRLGIGDDCAIVRPVTGDEIVVTTDMFLEQVHFRRDWHEAEVAGHRCLARGLSDIAAMGATPVAAFLSFALPPELAGAWTRRFLRGLLRLAAAHGVPLAGGDTAQSPSTPYPPQDAAAASAGKKRPGQQAGAASASLFVADIVLLGSVRRGQALLRSGARPGDLVYVTGALGGAAAELALLAKTPRTYSQFRRASSRHPHLFPAPRLVVGAALLRRASAAIDVSDGLSTDLAHLCEESSVAAVIEASRLPVHALAAAHPRAEALELALHGGEDYELLFTAPPPRRIGDTIAGVAVHQIGHIVAAGRGRPRVTLITDDGSRVPLRNRGWEHFKRSPATTG